MKRLIITTLAATLLAGTALSGTAMAAGQRYDDHDRGRYDQRHDDRRDDRHDDRYDRHDRRDYGHSRREAAHERRDYRRWERGQRLDARYRDNRYYVSDWRRHGLRAPPRGYRWQRVDDNYILAAVATGLIASVIIANH
ncbi:RcnB family protein [Caulobacter sp. BE254]|jgi:Ni/Co efflux regulator RcnB|uniref:RcnB family protein n=1 Tax=Caulobacter sp. BE254 TaxID=2817720 RepID=UPI002863B215|nr:RcnB family protein [Caulobacter sp. BE254]MDR7115702.1 Ni/Co efflux regulator RcnB [Caulobacter sp. BE254]